MGNTADHVHLHLVPRYESDPNFGSSPFMDTSRAVEPQLSDHEYRQIAKSLRLHLLGGTSSQSDLPDHPEKLESLDL